MVIKKVQSIELNLFPGEFENLAKQIIKEKFSGELKEKTLFNIGLQNNLFGELKPSAPVFHMKMDNKEIGIYKSKDWIYGGISVKF